MTGGEGGVCERELIKNLIYQWGGEKGCLRGGGVGKEEVDFL